MVPGRPAAGRTGPAAIALRRHGGMHRPGLRRGKRSRAEQVEAATGCTNSGLALYAGGYRDGGRAGRSRVGGAFDRRVAQDRASGQGGTGRGEGTGEADRRDRGHAASCHARAGEKEPRRTDRPHPPQGRPAGRVRREGVREGTDGGGRTAASPAASAPAASAPAVRLRAGTGRRCARALRLRLPGGATGPVRAADGRVGGGAFGTRRRPRRVPPDRRERARPGGGR